MASILCACLCVSWASRRASFRKLGHGALQRLVEGLCCLKEARVVDDHGSLRHKAHHEALMARLEPPGLGVAKVERPQDRSRMRHNWPRETAPDRRMAFRNPGMWQVSTVARIEPNGVGADDALVAEGRAEAVSENSA